MSNSSVSSSPGDLIRKWGVILALGVVSIYVGLSLATNLFTVFVLLVAAGWVISIPKHAMISIVISVATFRAAFIVPFFPGRPYLWELAALLGWTGFAVALAMRQAKPVEVGRLLQHKLMLIGLAGYCATLVVLMLSRGVGLNVLGSDQIGGRYYFQQMVCAIYPLLFLVVTLRVKHLVWLIYAQFLLALTHVVPDFVFSLGVSQFYTLLYFFEIPGDAYNFAAATMSFGIQRYQSLGWASIGVVLFLLSRRRIDDFLKIRSIPYIGLGSLMFLVGAFSGQRMVSLVLVCTILVCAYIQRAYTLKNVGAGLGLVLMGVAFVYITAPQLPMSAQRAVSFLPGIEISQMAREDANGTLTTRRMLRELGWQQVPNYFWVGRGFGQDARSDLSERWDPTSITLHLNQGRYYNGVIGLLVNTGFPGFLFMTLFIAGIMKVVWRTVRLLRRRGCFDRLSIAVSVVNAVFITNVFTFVFFHGDAEYAMKTFSLQAGLILACWYHLEQREKSEQSAVADDGAPA